MKCEIIVMALDAVGIKVSGAVGYYRGRASHPTLHRVWWSDWTSGYIISPVIIKFISVIIFQIHVVYRTTMEDASTRY